MIRRFVLTTEEAVEALTAYVVDRDKLDLTQTNKLEGAIIVNRKSMFSTGIESLELELVEPWSKK